MSNIHVYEIHILVCACMCVHVHITKLYILPILMYMDSFCL